MIDRRGRMLILATLGPTVAGCAGQPVSDVPCFLPAGEPRQAGPEVVVPGPVIRAEVSASTAAVSPIGAPFRSLPFAWPPGPAAGLAVYDRLALEVLWYPGAGKGVANVSRLDEGMWAYDDGSDVSVYDAHREERVGVVTGREVGGFAFQPTFASRETVYFLGQSDPGLAARGIGWLYVKREEAPLEPAPVAASGVSQPSPISPALGQARWVAPVNALAVRFGGLTSVSVDGQDSAVAFTTSTGRVFVYSPRTRQVTSRPNFSGEPGDQHAAQVTIDPVWGRFLVWHDTERKSIWVFDRWMVQLEPVPLVRFGSGVVSASSPAFHESDPTCVTVTLTLKGGRSRLALYRLSDGRVEALPVLNAFRGGDS